MKAKIAYFLHLLRGGAMQVVRRYPVEILLSIYFCVGCLYSYELDSDALMPRFALAPLFALLALAVNQLVGTGAWRKVYWVCWAPMLPLIYWSGLETWIQTPSALTTFGVLAPLTLLLSRRAVQNDRFVCDLIVWIRSGALAVIFANVTLGLFCAILYSTTYIFGLEGPWVEHVAVYAVILCETLVVPVLFLMISDRWSGDDCKGSRVIDILVNYIVTPALLIYTAILYLYMVKILFSWELPRGGVAYLVFGFTIALLSVQALQLVLQKRIYDWFFNYFSIIALPTQVLFWIGALRRVDEYGVTMPRVYLLVCGGLMTLCVAFFLSRKLGRYFWVGIAAWSVFALMAYVPGLSPERVATRSQTHRAERIAARLGMLSENGALSFDVMSGVDSTHYSDLYRLYQALDYIEIRDTAAFARFGLYRMSDFSDRLPETIREQVISDWDDGIMRGDRGDTNHLMLIPSKGLATNIEPYRVMYTDFLSWDDEEPNFRFENDTLRIWLGKEHPQLTIPGCDILAAQLRKIGQENDFPTMDVLSEHQDQLLNYADDQRMILFSSMELVRRDSTLRIEGLAVSAVLMR